MGRSIGALRPEYQFPAAELQAAVSGDLAAGN